jgi:hypothetical protein
MIPSILFAAGMVEGFVEEEELGSYYFPSEDEMDGVYARNEIRVFFMFAPGFADWYNPRRLSDKELNTSVIPILKSLYNEFPEKYENGSVWGFTVEKGSKIYKIGVHFLESGSYVEAREADKAATTPKRGSGTYF